MSATALGYAKAALAALVAGLGALFTALDDGNVSAQEWVTIALALLIALGGVAVIPNSGPKAPAGRHEA